jgi:hypothetical protein
MTLTVAIPTAHSDFLNAITIGAMIAGTSGGIRESNVRLKP